MTDDAELLHKFAVLLRKFDGSEKTPAEYYNSDAEELVAIAREHFSRPLPVTKTQMVSISHWGMFPV